MKKTYIIISALVLTGFINQSCSNDFIDVSPTEQVSAADLSLYNNNEGATSFVNSIYAKFLDWDMSTFSWIGVTSITSDDADKGSTPGDVGSDKDILDALTFTPSTPSFESLFASNYEGINRCNQALQYLPQLTNADESLRARLAGEAKFLRAFMYFTLVRSFGDVPLVDHVPSTGNPDDITMQLTRKSKAEVYAFIEKDLLDAAAALPNKSAYSGKDVGRATKGAAHALLAKVYLYQKKWQLAVDQANLVTGYSLTPDFIDIYKLSGENNSESIFEIQGSGIETGKGIQQYTQVQGARGTGGWGWGFNTPTQNLYDAFTAEGDTERRDATIIRKGMTLYDGRVVGSDADNDYYNYKAYSSAYTTQSSTDTNIRYLRFAEVLLIKAEALNELGQTSSAIPLLNQVRQRANISNTSASTQSDVRTAIWKERRLELAFEHDRWFDLVRTGQAQSALAANGKTFVVGKHEVFPLPQTFITEAKGRSAQNPNY
ncbi:RagB/SusD family nutrient uptake outer membrane protein [Chryseobacterium wangxinyae]|uniref:RagB/SusD family nutrient uptake outer membrane protein n=1 Tax=unclassified Chryseobacterium TaxID=2593645 RepID=UPI00226EA9A3|nr:MULTISPECIES: RagB/SusD family nutrient uptake outer membrane protein [unclassified Chryseobacterium]MCY0969366.1 RagB/SusD family nutrient uptake outer membrane protein [Chryseobacterium sp. CY353]MCY0976607.1 RagB/SusD family nutrient uptake outer membrane protein [Chryseobacterium sp. CY350]WBZ96608.1 RagB/SusD family nutrient uptake outer membrane protein [Chryseobacterium sp. CY350]